MIVLLYLLYGTRVSARRVYRRIHHTSGNQLRIALEPFSELNSFFWSSSRGVGERSRAKTQVAGTRPGAPIIPHAVPLPPLLLNHRVQFGPSAAHAWNAPFGQAGRFAKLVVFGIMPSGFISKDGCKL